MRELLTAHFGEKVSFAPATLAEHGRDEGYPETRPVDAVVFAESVDDVALLLGLAARNGFYVIPFGGGTSLEGHLLPLKRPTVSLDLSRMDRILEVSPEDFLAVVEPGVTREALNARLRPHGLFFPVDPGANATLGGMAATNASGTTTVKYGGMHQNVLALEAVMVGGERVRFGRPVRKSSSGYDLKDLFIGSEGTLGVITKLYLKLHPLPAHVHTLRVFFPSIAAAAEGAYAVMGSGLPVARLELLDENALKAVNRYLGSDYPERSALFLEFHSSTEAAIASEASFARELLLEAGADSIDAAASEADRKAQWEARHQAYWALVRLFPERAYVITDTAVPLSRLPSLVVYAQTLMDELGLVGSILGHVGDGNFHTIVAVTEEDYHLAETYSTRLVQRALELGGTATGEHGVGIRKKKFMTIEHAEALEWMRKLKAAFDPLGLLNPGKILP